MRFDVFALGDRLWEEVANNFMKPSRDLPEAVVLLVTIRMLLVHAVRYMDRFASHGLGVREPDALERSLRSHNDVIAAVDHALLHLSRGRGLTGAELWDRFACKQRETAVCARDEIACILRLRGGFSALSNAERIALCEKIAGHTPLGAALTESPSFQRRLAAAFEDPRVAHAILLNGPISGAEQVLALYVGVSVTTIRRRRKVQNRA